MQQTSLLIPLTLTLAGIGIPVMAALNSGLGTRLSSPLAAVFILSLVAAISSFTLLATNGQPSWSQVAQVPVPYFLGGVIFVFYLTAITFGAPRIGLGTAVLLVLFGQLASAALIDHLSLFGTEGHPLTGRRLLGLGLVSIGIVLAKS